MTSQPLSYPLDIPPNETYPPTFTSPPSLSLFEFRTFDLFRRIFRPQKKSFSRFWTIKKESVNDEFHHFQRIRRENVLGEGALRPISDLNFDELFELGMCDFPCWLWSPLEILVEGAGLSLVPRHQTFLRVELD